MSSAPALTAARPEEFQVPQTAGVRHHDVLTVSAHSSGGIDSAGSGAGSGAGAAVGSSFGGPADAVTYP